MKGNLFLFTIVAVVIFTVIGYGKFFDETTTSNKPYYQNSNGVAPPIVKDEPTKLRNDPKREYYHIIEIIDCNGPKKGLAVTDNYGGEFILLVPCENNYDGVTNLYLTAEEFNSLVLK